MDQKILEFAALLRKAGIKISHSEVRDCLVGLSMVNPDRDFFYNVLSAALIKDHSVVHIFDKLFYYFFSPEFFAHHSDHLFGEKLPVMKQSGIQCSGDDPVTGIEGGRSTGFGRGQGIDTESVERFVNIIKLGNHEEMIKMVKKGVNSLGMIREEDLKDMKEVIRQVKISLEWNMGVNRLEQEAAGHEETLWLDWQERLKFLESHLMRETELKIINDLGEKALDVILKRENINQLDFFQLSANQVPELKKKLSRIGHRLASRLSFRRKRAKKGVIDLSGTIRKSIATGGVPVKLAYRDRFPTRPEFVILCDISGSVKIFSEFMLQLMYSIQSRFIHVRSFVFIDTPDEVTGYFANREIEDGIKEIYNRASFSKTAFSNYGEVFIDFCHKYFDSLSKKTTLVVIGDARNNYNKEQADYFQKMCNEVKQVIWLNPEPVARWDREDSVMSVYGSFCSLVYECRNLEQLERLAQKLI